MPRHDRPRPWYTRALARALALSVSVSAIGAGGAQAEGFMRTRSDGTLELTNVRKGRGWKRIDYFGEPRWSRKIATPPSRREKSPERYSRFDHHIKGAAALYALPVALVRAVMHVESDFDPNVVSVDGAMGLMQLMPFTAQKMGVRKPFDPFENIYGGARFLRILANHWKGSLVHTIASYNAGVGAVTRYGGVPPFAETRRYVQRVMERYNAYRLQYPG